MAFAAILFGGIIGFISFLMAFLLLDFELLAAIGIYLSTGFGSVFLLLAINLTVIWVLADDAKQSDEAHSRDHD